MILLSCRTIVMTDSPRTFIVQHILKTLVFSFLSLSDCRFECREVKSPEPKSRMFIPCLLLLDVLWNFFHV